ncbi:molecular chaperone HtpG [Aminivibrio sp.]|jgi:molecular chaperone HtpG|uniref:molecular chaperone HtpG n=1 Tax=Aminivibrio sp. TaxID=1872489 RepID=UPI0025BB7BE0|nr:molecular chaperone HtpG [Aminivibrio sp.]MDK2959591.1 molecular chaperone HtpG [Synergistaceae bacterium]
MEQERFSFQAEAKQLLDLMIHSVYSNRDIFLRELISNASDALDKRRLELLAHPEFADREGESGLSAPSIRISRGAEGRTLFVSDNGVGMNREELTNYIGTIARSGTGEFLAAMKAGRESVGAESLIGRFGVGFYSAFMVADRVEVVTRRLGEGKGWRFSSPGDGTYTLEEAERNEPGTTVILHLKTPDREKGERDYADEWTLRDIVKRYSDFISYPIVMSVSKTPEGGEEAEDLVLNSGKALWRRPEKDVTDQEYEEFYKHIASDWEPPLGRVVFSVEGGTEFRGILFFPSKAPFDLHYAPRSEGVSLYIRNVFIMNDCRDLVPSWLRFLRGVVDSEDLPLNISREILQEDPLVRIIRKSLVRRVLAALKKMMADDREKYVRLWKEFGPVIKEGLASFDGTEKENREAILEICLFPSASSGDGFLSLGEYVEAMKEGQQEIYYITGKKLQVLRNSPLLERCREKGYDVLLLADPVDEVIAPTLPHFRGKEFRSLEREDALPPEERGKDAPRPEGLASFLKEVLSETVKDVKISSRLTDSPACLVSDDDGTSFNMERILRSMGREVPLMKRIMEINPDHPVIVKMDRLLATGGSEEKVREYAFLLHDQCVLAEGGQIADPARFAGRLSALLVENLDATGRDSSPSGEAQ